MVFDPIESRILRRRKAAEARADGLRACLSQVAGLLSERGARRVVLFGSLATGRTHIASDVDLLVSGLPAEAYAEIWSRLELLLAARVDLVREEEASAAFVSAALSDGIDVTSWGQDHVAG